MMRRILGAVAVLVAVVGLMACEPTPPKPTEPSMTITAKPDAYPLASDWSHVTGKVTPAAGTKKVVLQKTSGGKWVDWKACAATRVCTGDAVKIPTANVNQSTGAYSITYPVQWCGKVLHLRVRSNGGTKFSPAFYTQADPYEAC